MKFIQSCRLCVEKEFKFLYSAKNYSIVKCKNCDLIQIKESPSLEDLQNVYSIKFFDKGKFTDDVAFALETKRRLKLINTVAQNNQLKILDYGCATGEFVKNCSGSYDIYGVDFSLEAINRAKDLYPSLQNKLFTLHDSELYVKNFDIVTGWDIIEHANDPLATIDDMVKLIHHEGYIILSTPNINTLTAKVLKERWAFMIPPEHICYFDRNTIKSLFKHYNTNIVNWSTKGKWVNLAFLFYKLKQSFGIIPQSIVEFLKRSFLKKICVYIPTGDIQYIVIKVKKD